MRSSTVARVAPLAIFMAALIANRRAATSLLAWSDTFKDQSDVDRCLVENLCTLLGTQTSIRGFFHAVAWLDLRALLQWLGVGPAGLLWFVQVLNALAATIVFQLAARLGGLLAGAVAAAVLVLGISPGFPPDGVHNLSSLPFLGAVLTVACSAIVAAPGIAAVVLAALVAAVMSNVHIVCVLTGVSVACSALAARRRRFALAAIGVAVFSVTTVGFAPPSWRQNLLAVLGGEPGVQATAGAAWPRTEVAWWTLLAIATWTGSLVTRAGAWAAYRRAAIGALAVALPTLTAVLLAPAFGIYTEAKYLAPVHAACATAAALALGRTLQALLGAALSPATCRAVELGSPFAVGLGIAVGAALAVEHPEQAMTVDDLAAAAHVLRAEQRWDDRHVVRAFSTPQRVDVLTGLLQQRTGDVPAGSETDVTHDTATLIKVQQADLPDPLPRTWRVLRRSSGDATVLVVDRARLDWRRFEVCVPAAGGATERCDAVTWEGFDPLRDAVNALPYMPPAGVRWTGMLRLRVPVLPHAGPAGGAIFMPRGFLCGGRVVAVRGIAAAISDDRRRLTFAGGLAGAAAASVELEWSVGSPECDAWQYDGLPPFIIEGEPTDVDRLERVFRRRELGDAAAGAS
jgi:hypothetical protein